MASTLPFEICIVQCGARFRRMVGDDKTHQLHHLVNFSHLKSLKRNEAPSAVMKYAVFQACGSCSRHFRNDHRSITGESIGPSFIQTKDIPVSMSQTPNPRKFTCFASGNFGPGSHHDIVSREYLIQYYRWLAERKAESLRQLEEMNREEEGTVFLSEVGESSSNALESRASLNLQPLQLLRVEEENEVKMVVSSPSWLKRWEVPWGAKEVTFGMVSWIFSFGISGLLVQFAAHQSGWEPWMDGGDGISLYLLANESVRTILGLCIVYLVIKPFAPLSQDFFHFGVSRPFSLNSGWLLWSAVGFSCACAAVQLSAIAMANLSGHVPTRAEGDALVEVLPVIAFSPMSTLTLVMVTGVCAPILEETVFRGFLMTSLTKWMPTPIAAFLSACAFAAAHLSPDQFPKLAALGMVLGISYAKTRNLLTPIIVHSIWNSGIILALTFLRMEGQNIGKYL